VSARACPEWATVGADGELRPLPCECPTCLPTVRLGTVTGEAATRETIRAIDALPEPVEPAPAPAPRPHGSLALELRLLGVLGVAIAIAWALRQLADLMTN
jgi:hypothetical protein